MSKSAPTVDEVLFAPLAPSAIGRAERALGGDEARELAEGRVAAEALAKSVAASTTVSTTAEALKARVVASAARKGANESIALFADRVARLFDVSVAEAARLLAQVEANEGLEPGPVAGVSWLSVKAGPKAHSKGTLAAIGRLRPGMRFPLHAHNGEETTLVLDGGFRSGDEEIWRGDELVQDGGSEHDFVVLEGRDCIAAVLAKSGIELR